MKNMFKNWNIGGLLVLLFAVMLTVSWKNYEEKKAAPQWYTVTPDPSDPTDETLQAISPTPLPGNPTGDCKPEPGIICAVKLDLDGAPVPSTIAEAEDNEFDTSTRMHKKAN